MHPQDTRVVCLIALSSYLFVVPFVCEIVCVKSKSIELHAKIQIDAHQVK